MQVRLLCSLNVILWDLGCIVRVEFAFCLWHSSKVLAALLVSGLEVQSIFFFGLPLGFHAGLQNTKKGLTPLV